MKEEVYRKTEKGKELFKITNALVKFKKRYPERISQCLAFIGIYDDKAVMKFIKGKDPTK